MASLKNNNLKIANPTINKIINKSRYDPEDISEAEKAFVLKHTVAPRKARTDLKTGDIVVVLEGAHTGKRVIFIKQIENNKAVVAGIKSINNATCFKIDERFLFKLNASVTINDSKYINFNTDNLYESMMFESEKLDTELTKEEESLDKYLLSIVTGINFMAKYLAEPFKIDNTVEFYSQDY